MTEDERNGGPAFPCVAGAPWGGMTLRDYFAGQVIAGVMAGVFSNQEAMVRLKLNDIGGAELASVAYETADAMLEVRKP